MFIILAVSAIVIIISIYYFSLLFSFLSSQALL